MALTIEGAIRFAEYAQIMADGKPDVQEFYKLAEFALRDWEERQWIPVTERLPESEGTYLVYTERGCVYASHFYAKKVFRDDYVREAQWSQRGKVNVTHWMYLPKPPMEDA